MNAAGGGLTPEALGRHVGAVLDLESQHLDPGHADRAIRARGLQPVANLLEFIAFLRQGQHHHVAPGPAVPGAAGLQVPQNEGLGRSLVTDDIDGDGVRDVVASTMKNRLLILLLAAGGRLSSGWEAGAVLKDTVWVDGLPPVPFGCRMGNAMHLLPPLHLYPTGSRVALARPCNQSSEHTGTIQVAVLQPEMDGANATAMEYDGSIMPRASRIVGWEQGQLASLSVNLMSDPANRHLQRAVYFGSELPVLFGRNVTRANYSAVRQVRVGSPGQQQQKYARPAQASLSAVSVLRRDIDSPVLGSQGSEHE